MEKELDKYIKQKHTQEECVGFIAGWEAAMKRMGMYKVENESEKLEMIISGNKTGVKYKALETLKFNITGEEVFTKGKIYEEMDGCGKTLIDNSGDPFEIESRAWVDKFKQV